MTNANNESAGEALELVLYGTTACHLCEVAQQLLDKHHQYVEPIAYRLSDISDSDALFQRYGVRIPVLQRADGAELDWPFSPAQLGAFLMGK